MSVSMQGDTICVKMPGVHSLMAFYYKRVGADWVQYKRHQIR